MLNERIKESILIQDGFTFDAGLSSAIASPFPSYSLMTFDLKLKKIFLHIFKRT